MCMGKEGSLQTFDPIFMFWMITVLKFVLNKRRIQKLCCVWLKINEKANNLGLEISKMDQFRIFSRCMIDPQPNWQSVIRTEDSPLRS